MKVKHGLHILVTAALLTLPLSGCVGENSEVSPKSTSSDTSVSSTAEISEISEETSLEDQSVKKEQRSMDKEQSTSKNSEKQSSDDIESKLESADESPKADSQESSYIVSDKSVPPSENSVDNMQRSENTTTTAAESSHETPEKSELSPKSSEVSKPEKENSSCAENSVAEKNTDEQILITSSENLWTDKKITVKVGKKVKWYIDVPENTNVYEGMGGREDLKRNSCAYSIKIPALGIGSDSYSYEESHIDFSAGRTFVCEFTPIEVGDIMFTCWMGKDCHCNYIHVVE